MKEAKLLKGQNWQNKYTGGVIEIEEITPYKIFLTDGTYIQYFSLLDNYNLI